MNSFYVYAKSYRNFYFRVNGAESDVFNMLLPIHTDLNILAVTRRYDKRQ
jgi:hypothetical protein